MLPCYTTTKWASTAKAQYIFIFGSSINKPLFLQNTCSSCLWHAELTKSLPKECWMYFRRRSITASSLTEGDSLTAVNPLSSWEAGRHTVRWTESQSWTLALWDSLRHHDTCSSSDYSSLLHFTKCYMFFTMGSCSQFLQKWISQLDHHS